MKRMTRLSRMSFRLAIEAGIFALAALGVLLALLALGTLLLGAWIGVAQIRM
jgi:hypothetical protein